jgi:hypothetical protein
MSNKICLRQTSQVQLCPEGASELAGKHELLPDQLDRGWTENASLGWSSGSILDCRTCYFLNRVLLRGIFQEDPGRHHKLHLHVSFDFSCLSSADWECRELCTKVMTHANNTNMISPSGAVENFLVIKILLISKYLIFNMQSGAGSSLVF